jgi:hypothetical protein
MRDIVHKVLKEIKDLHNVESREERIGFIKYNKEYIEKLLPMIVKFFEQTFKDNLDKVEVKSGGVAYGNEGFSAESFKLVFYFNQIPEDSNFSVRKEIITYLINIFGIDVTRYGIPLSITILVKEWKLYEY